MLRELCLLACALASVPGAPLCAVVEVGEHKQFSSIAEAARACSAGDTILVEPGLYVEYPIDLKEGCTLVSTAPGQAAIIPAPPSPLGTALFPREGSLIRGFWFSCASFSAVDCSGCAFELQNCVLWGNPTAIRFYGPPNRILLTNCTICGNEEGIVCQNGGSAVLVNTVVYGNRSNLVGELANISAAYSCIEGGFPGEGNIAADPMYANGQQCDCGELTWWPETYSPWPDFRLRADSPCIDAGFNDPELPLTDIAGMHRIMFGGKSLTVDMGAYEFYINKLEPVPGTDEAIFTWSSLADRTYSIFYTDNLLTWHLVIDNFRSAGSRTTSWTDDGSLTGLPPSLAPKRFYRLLENP